MNARRTLTRHIIIFAVCLCTPWSFATRAFGEEQSTIAEFAFDLEYRPSGFGAYVPADFVDEQFDKEPDWGGRKILRGILAAEPNGVGGVAFVWDRQNGKLYVDCNNNRDLTDDPAGVFENTAGKSLLQVFDNIHINIERDNLRLPYVLRLSLFAGTAATRYCTATVVSGYCGDIELYGRKWRMWAADNIDGKINRADFFSLEPPRLDSPVSEYNWNKRIPRTIFLGGHNYRFSSELRQGTTGPILHVVLTEIPTATGQLNIKGKFTRPVTLRTNNDNLTVIDVCESTVAVPAGDYRPSDIYIDAGKAGIFTLSRYSIQGGEITIGEDKPATLTIGGPLRNTVEVKRMGRILTLDYKLLGAGNCEYVPVRTDNETAPTFVVFCNDKEIASGKFAYG